MVSGILPHEKSGKTILHLMGTFGNQHNWLSDSNTTTDASRKHKHQRENIAENYIATNQQQPDVSCWPQCATGRPLLILKMFTITEICSVKNNR